MPVDTFAESAVNSGVASDYWDIVHRKAERHGAGNDQADGPQNLRVLKESGAFRGSRCPLCQLLQLDLEGPDVQGNHSGHGGWRLQ